ncbi:YdeI/OmpD-associated family protein [Clavibacter michiganensis subsp. phaseoli]|uniref:YdeI/OmpD-associated family protein n=1 Tax=Clavibacter phaseoli TaxID=1734031 RepID=UPI001FB27C4B|nr:YdeI/OmpD-associated family protein [Clavibacter phaseoli]MCJ1709571.1 YdeI/OmpD-associated family protein [Clavibacter phaseoli]
MPTFRTRVMQARVNATGLPVPPEALDELGAGKRPAVVVTVAGYTYRTSVGTMGGQHLIPLSAASGVAADDEVEVTIELDAAPREAAVPEEVAAAFATEPALAEAFRALSSSRQRALVDPIAEAKTDETRPRRIEKALAALRG